jgi:phenol 2-monooxygenase (NADPH)
VLRGRCAPHLLHTYSAERQAIAKELIDFDREWAALMASSKGFDAAETQRYFVQHGRYTAGTATRYQPALLTGEASHQHLAKGLTIGMRFHSAPVIRVADAKPVHLGHVVKADGRWRIFAFAGAGDTGARNTGIRALCGFLAEAQASPVRKYTPADEDIDAVIDVRAVFQQAHRELAIEAMPSLLLPPKGRYGLRDYEKVFSADLKSGQDIFALRGIDREQGCLVIVRPDQFVAHVLPLDAHAQLAAYFEGFMVAAERAATAAAAE